MNSAIAIHTFAGGFAMGMAKHLACQMQVDVNGDDMTPPRKSEHKTALQDARINHPWPVLALDQEKIRTFKHNAEVVFSNPPCAIWSNMNTKSKHWKDDARLQMIDDPIESGLANDSKAIIIESVLRSWTAGRNFWINRARMLNERGYGVYIWLHNTKYMGGLQDRVRFMFIATKLKITFPEVAIKPLTIGEDLENLQNLEPGITYEPKVMNEDIRKFWLHAKPGRLKEQVPTGLDHKPSFAARKLCLSKPAPTMVNQYVVHPTEARCLSLNEFRHIIGFPDTWKSSRKQERSCDVIAGLLPMTRGVSPKTGEHLGSIMANAMEYFGQPGIQIIDQTGGGYAVNVPLLQ